MHQREQQHASTVTELHVLVHSGLKPYFDPPRALLGALRSGLDRVDFIDPEELTSPCGALDLPVLMPVTGEFQTEELQAVRVRHPLSLLVAVTRDLSGYRTYDAIRSGANFVLNLAIPCESQRDVLYAQLRAHLVVTSGNAVTAGPQGIPAGEVVRQRCRYTGGETAPSVEADREGDISGGHPPSALPSYDAELMRLLCTSITVSEIARRYYYCSERSMYRRIRRLYDDVGVGGRAELISLAAVLGPRQPLSARAC
ncbi:MULTISPECIES: helix-turn-helix transcriptional regulator [unclassified Streptomyces]|uniref:helix-turn-helix transcriptional regulator n=1 Tax=unclassified Streptomyces TaxID=2593676 RepID=UPI0036EA71ED